MRGRMSANYERLSTNKKMGELHGRKPYKTF